MAVHHVEIQWTDEARKSLREIGSRTIQQKIVDKVAAISASVEPEKLGKPLIDEFQGLFRASFGRYRIIYRVVRDERNPARLCIIVRVVLAGIRKQGDKVDIYEVAKKLRRQGRLP